MFVRVCNPSFYSLVMCIASCVYVLASLPLLGRPKFKTLRTLYQNITYQPSQACIYIYLLLIFYWWFPIWYVIKCFLFGLYVRESTISLSNWDCGYPININFLFVNYLILFSFRKNNCVEGMLFHFLSLV